ncbi:MAG: hypothetical protein WKF81_07955, partial [Thermomicrobiales bacterium]
LGISDEALAAFVQARTASKLETSVVLPGSKQPLQRLKLGNSDQTIRLPGSLATAQECIALVNLDLVANHGPFVLDLLARYLHKLDRARIIVSPNRTTTIVELNLVRRFDAIAMAVTIDGVRIWLETRDLIAGELAALALSEGALPKHRRHFSPWEDDLVQLATERLPGARYPGDIRLAISEDDRNTTLDQAVSSLHFRLGIDISTVSDHY